MMNFLILFFILSMLNVVFSTIRSIALIKGSNFTASITSGGYFAFYNIVLLYTVADFPMWEKCLITFTCNVVGVWLVKFFEKKFQKEKLWKIEATVQHAFSEQFQKHLDLAKIPYSYIDIDRYCIFNIYCDTKADSALVKDLVSSVGAKYFASESKSL